MNEMVFGHNIRVRTIGVYSIVSLLIGAFVVMLILLFTSLVNHHAFTYDGIRQMYSLYNVLYLINLIPLFFVISGGLYGNYVHENKHSYTRTIDRHASSIKKVIAFSKEIGKGNLEATFQAEDGEEELKETLEAMRQDLLEASRKEHERNLIIRAVGEVSALLNAYYDIQNLSDKILEYLVDKLEGAVQGAFYVVNSNDENEEKYLEMTASYAYNRKKHLNARFRFAQGLVGQAAAEKDIIMRTEIPDDYVSITSGLLGDKKPGCIILTPLISNDEVYGVIELAALQKFTSLQIRMLQELSEMIASSIFNVLINAKTCELLAESKEKSRELALQKQQLIEKAQETIATQEELRETNLKLEQQIEEVHRGNKKTQVLLENASEIITIFSPDGEIKFVSPSVRHITGYFPEELVGRQSTENVHPQDAESFGKMLEKIISFPEEIKSFQFRYFKKSGEILWMEGLGKNLINDPVINGIVVNSRDISAQRLAEKEQRMRAKMQALSENSPDIIIRIDIFSRCIYINPVIESYTGQKPAAFLNKPIADMGLDEEVIRHWKNILSTVAGQKKKTEDELIFPTPDGDRILSIQAIPEFSENEEIDSVLIISHDITEARKREELIRMKNKAIEDSINYAYNIQSSLMPTEKDIQKYLPNSFMVYMPKDVVSGDYPWMFQYKEDLYLGVMDCTGHGVPGALMSLIGYFLQNQVVQKNKQLDAGKFLDELHETVVESLRQEDPNSKTNDGMDAAFCKINLHTREVQYAGAHRPLYHVRKGVLSEVKGDRFPVGSTQYKTRKPFTNHTVRMLPGDTMYIMSDGFADQYGGPTRKEKYMVGRVKKLIESNDHLSIFQMSDLFRNTFHEWKGDNKQMDDILIMGIKF